MLRKERNDLDAVGIPCAGERRPVRVPKRWLSAHPAVPALIDANHHPVPCSSTLPNLR
jgi:hypothetical protein